MLKSNVTKKLSVISALLGLLTLFTALNLNFACCAANPKNHKPSSNPLTRTNSVVPGEKTDADQPTDSDDFSDLNKPICTSNLRLPNNQASDSSYDDFSDLDLNKTITYPTRKKEITNKTNPTLPNNQDSDSDEVLELNVNVSFDPNTSLPTIDPVDENNANEGIEPISTNKIVDTK